MSNQGGFGSPQYLLIMHQLYLNHAGISPEKKEYYNSLTNLQLVERLYELMEEMERYRKITIKARNYDVWFRNKLTKEYRLTEYRREQGYLVGLLIHREAFLDLTPYINKGE